MADGDWSAVRPVVPVSRYIVGTWCPRGGGHFDLMADEDYDGSCGSKGWPLVIEVDDEDDPRPLPAGYFEDEE